MKKKGIRSSAVAGLLACALTMSLIPVQSALAQPTGSEDSMRQSIEKMVQNPASYTVSLDLEGGTIPDLSDEGWTQSGDDVWTTVLTQEQIMSGGGVSMPSPERSGYLFAGWLASDGSEPLSQLTNYPISQDTTFTATWQQSETSTDSEDPNTPESTETEQTTPKKSDVVPTPNALSASDDDQSSEQESNAKYSITFSKAAYQATVGVSGTNTINFSHVNANYPAESMTVEGILEFLNQYVPSVKLDYTITYTDATGMQTTVSRSEADIPIKWTEDNADFSGVESSATAMNGTAFMVRLNEDYLKGLIVGYEKTVSQGEVLPEATGLTQNDFVFPQWGTLDETQNIYTGGDADKLALTIKIGVTQNKDQNIGENKKDYTIDTVSPSNVTLNLFDYWLSSDAYYDGGDTAGNVLYPYGINKGHGLVFFKNGAAGNWNKWPGKEKGPVLGIVKNQLDAENGYPVLNLKETFKSNGQNFGAAYPFDPEENLQYLFDPETLNANGNGKGYSSVKNLFKINEEGNYYFSSHDNFAEFDPESNSFNVYNTWGVKQSGSSPQGQFFPFNTAEQVFNLDTDGKLVQASDVTSTNPLINHYLGLTMDAEFQQPVNGMVSVGTNAKPMVFDFSGDDDVWIFIDGVLVADLGGIHDEASVEIDFSTGKVVTYLAADKTKQTNRVEKTLKAIFEAANKSTSGFNGNTFGNNTTHTLKMFYLERGNYDSNLTLSFNLMEPKNDTLVKLDQDGEPVAGAIFSIYPAKLEDGKYVTDGEAIATGLTSNEEGEVQLPTNYDFSQHDYYILKETVPDGYFSPGQVVLQYDRFEKHPDGTSSGTNLLMVKNRWETGAVSNFSAMVYQAGTLKYDDGTTIKSETGQQGLILAVPLLKGTDGEWHPLYGSNMSGFHDVDYQSGGNDETDNQRRAILKAALYQIYGANDQDQYSFPQWYLEWNQEHGRYEGDLNDLPGDASRYYWASNDPRSDLSMAYYFLDLQALSEIFGEDIVTSTSQEKLDAIATKIGDEAGQCEGESIDDKVQCAVESLTAKIDEEKTDNGKSGFALLDVSDFNRVFSSRIYIPNIQPELSVLKLDEQGNPLSGAEFSLYKDASATDPCASGTTDSNGRLVFSAVGTDQSGSAKVVLQAGYYWIRETSVPEGYTGNDEVVPVYVTKNGRVYADALDANDGITVRKGLGRLVETMVRYAAEDSVNTTLQDITATLVTGNDWGSVGSAVNGNTTGNSSKGEILNLHYGLDNALLEYGTHEVNGVRPNPYFEVDEDIPGIQVRQNYDAHKGESIYNSVAAKTNLEDTNIRGLFTGSTTIVVRNRKTGSQGSFSVAKTVTGSDAETNKVFDFDVSITGNDTGTGDASWDGKATYTVTGGDAENPLQTGTLTFTEHDGTWQITDFEKDESSTDEKNYFAKGTDPSYYRMQLSDGQKISVTGVPFGMTVSVKETNAGGYVTSVTVNNGDLTPSFEASGVVEKPVGDPSFHFYNNEYKPADLTLEKLLASESDSTTFPFTIELWSAGGDQPLAGSYNYTVTRNNGANEEGTIDKGELIVSLGNRDTLRIKGLPVGAQYTIKETTKGYAPTVKVDGNDVNVVDGAISGTIQEKEEDGSQAEGNGSQPAVTEVVYTNTRSGSITITKRNGTGQLLSGAGFTLYTKDASGKLTEFTPERQTALAMRYTVDDKNEKFDRDAMRYNDGTESYVVHSANANGVITYFYYRFLTEDEQNQYDDGKLEGQENVEAIVQFDELPLDKTYAIQETTVPQGYVQNADFEQEMSGITLPKDNVYDVLYTVVNHKQMTLPTSGLDGIGKMLSTGLLLTTLAAVLLWLANRRIPGAGPDPKRHSRH